jgi:hypothetical protein
MSSGNTFNFGGVQQTASGQGSVNQVGNNTATINNSGSNVPSVEQVYEAVLQSVPEEVREEIETEVIQPIKMELQSLSANPIALTEEKKQSVVEWMTEKCRKLLPYAQAIHPRLIAFGKVALTAVPPPANLFCSALLAACEVPAES